LKCLQLIDIGVSSIAPDGGGTRQYDLYIMNAPFTSMVENLHEIVKLLQSVVCLAQNAGYV
jgi:hypothetical protein